MTSRIDRNNSRDHFRKAEVLIDLGRPQEAIAELSQHLARYPDNYITLCNLALCHVQLKQYQEAYNWTKKAIESFPDGEWAYRLQSTIFRLNGESVRAIAPAMTSLEKNPESPAALITLFWAFATVGRLDEAEEPLRQFGRIDPHDVEFLIGSGYLASKRKDHAEAERYYLEALKVDPESIEALNNLGVVYLNLAQAGKGLHYKHKAQELFERAVRTQPTFELGQKNMSIAANATKVGIPIGLILMLWYAAQMFAGFAREAGEGRTPPIGATLKALDPLAPTVLLTAANLFFLALVVVGLGAITTCASKLYRERLRYEFTYYRGWLALSLPFLVAIILFFTAFELDGIVVDKAPPFSLMGTTVSIVMVVFGGVNLVSRWSKRPRKE